MTNRRTLAEDQALIGPLIAARGFRDYRWIDPARIVVSEWVRMKCRFGCGDYGRFGTCPPNLPDVAACRAFFGEYALAAVLHVEMTEPDHKARRRWSNEAHVGLLALERDVFLEGFEKAFALVFATCRQCAECAPRREECKLPDKARPTPEALAVDVYSTARAVGYPIEVVTAVDEAHDRYAILLVR
jgi:predicted metal-binding protein